MDVKDLHIGIEQKLQNIASFQTLNILPAEKDYWLTIAQNSIINNLIKKNYNKEELSTTEKLLLSKIKFKFIPFPFSQGEYNLTKEVIIPENIFSTDVYCNLNRTQYPSYNNSFINSSLIKDDSEIPKFMTNELNIPFIPAPRHIFSDNRLFLFYDKYTTINEIYLNIYLNDNIISIGYTDDNKEVINTENMILPILPEMYWDDLVTLTTNMIMNSIQTSQAPKQ